MLKTLPFDAVLLIAFGGPQGPDDVLPFLHNVLRGRKVPAARVQEVAKHYDLFDGISPITKLTQMQAAALEKSLKHSGNEIPVFVGMRNWHPFIVDTLSHMSKLGLRRPLGFIMAGHASYSSCEQYRQNILDARLQLQQRGLADLNVHYVSSWYTHPDFINCMASRVLDARKRLPAGLATSARVVFTAHSIPTRLADTSRYESQLLESCTQTAEAADVKDWSLVYQSRSGNPQDPWLGPDVRDYLTAEHSKGLNAIILCPIGFVTDHVEVLYDLDTEVAALCQNLQLPMVRASTANDHPTFINMMTDMVLSTCARYKHGVPLPLATETANPHGAR